MILIDNIHHISGPFPSPIGLTIGTFDGLHLGHQHLLSTLRAEISPQGTLCVFSFKNHPSTVLSSSSSTPMLCTLEHKIHLLEQMGIDLVILQTFSLSFSQVPFDVFLEEIKELIPFQYLMLGEGESFGRNKQGDEQKIKDLSKKLGFQVSYLEKQKMGEDLISSRSIRRQLSQGNLKRASELLGRPYSIYTKYFTQTSGKEVLIPSRELLLLPDGAYPALCKGYDEKNSCLLPCQASMIRAKNRIDVSLEKETFFRAGQPIELVFLN